MTAINTGAWAALQKPLITALFGMEYNELEQRNPTIFQRYDSQDAYEDDMLAPGFGLAQVKTEGASVAFTSHQQGVTQRYRHQVYGLGYIVTQEEFEDNKAEGMAAMRARALGASMRRTKETVSANVLNRAFQTTDRGDGVALCSAAHPTLAGNQSNVLPVAADFSEAALEDLIIQTMLAVDENGQRIAVRPIRLIVPVQLAFQAERVLNSELRSGTANNDVNAIRSMGLLPQGVVSWAYLTDPDAFFLQTDVPHGLKMYQRREVSVDQDRDFATNNVAFKATERYSFGASDFRGVFASPGA